jgi:hypothetical protein
MTAKNRKNWGWEFKGRESSKYLSMLQKVRTESLQVFKNLYKYKSFSRNYNEAKAMYISSTYAQNIK